MTATTKLWERHLNETHGSHPHPTVVFTTEAKSMIQEQQSWVKENEQSKLPFQFDFVMNELDILPDSGFIRDIGTYEHILALLVYRDNCCASYSVPFVLAAIYSGEKPRDRIRCRRIYALLHVFIENTITSKSIYGKLLLQFPCHAQ